MLLANSLQGCNRELNALFEIILTVRKIRTITLCPRCMCYQVRCHSSRRGILFRSLADIFLWLSLAGCQHLPHCGSLANP